MNRAQCKAVSMVNLMLVAPDNDTNTFRSPYIKDDCEEINTYYDIIYYHQWMYLWGKSCHPKNYSHTVHACHLCSLDNNSRGKFGLQCLGTEHNVNMFPWST